MTPSGTVTGLVYLYLAAVGLILVLVLALRRVVRRYEHTHASLRWLAAEAVLSIVVGEWLAFEILSWEMWWRIMSGMLLAVPFFIIEALSTVEIWRIRKQSVFDRMIRQLETQVDDCRGELDLVTWKIRQRQMERWQHHENDRSAGERQRIEDRIRNWTEGSGKVRLRSIKVRDWKDNYRRMSDDERKREWERLEQQMADAEAGRSEELEVQRACLRLVELENEPAEEAGGRDSTRNNLSQERRRLEARLERIEQELGEWRARKQEFLEGPILLD